MTTTSELHALAEMLGLVDISDAASYLGEETAEIEEQQCQYEPHLFLLPFENLADNE